MLSSARTIPGTQDQFGRGRATIRVHGQTGTRTNTRRAITPFMFNEEGYRVSSSCAHRSTCTDRVLSTLVTRRVENILLLTTFIVVPTPMTWIKTGSKICSIATLSTPSVAWPVASYPVTILIPTSALLSVGESSVTTRVRKSGIPSWRPPWSTLAL